MDGLDKDLAQVNALALSSAELLREHPVGTAQKQGSANPVEEHEKTLAGLAIGSTLDLVMGKEQTSQGRIDRAHKCDQYAEIAADTFSSIPKFSVLTSGIAHSVLLIDVSGQKSVGGVATGMALNFLQGAAFNSVSRMASSESAVGRAMSSPAGRRYNSRNSDSCRIRVVDLDLSRAACLKIHGWTARAISPSAAAYGKIIAAGTTAGTLIGIPAGMVGLRVGKAVTLGMGSQVEHSVMVSTVQKMATGAGSGFASGSVFGGVDAAKSGKSLSEILDSTFQGGMVGLATGALSSGFDRTPLGGLSASHERLRLAAESEVGRASMPQGAGHARDLGQLGQTERLIERSDLLMAPAALIQAHERLSYGVPIEAKIEDFSHRLKQQTAETRSASALKDGAPQTYAAYKTALKDLNPNGEPLDINKHFWNPFVNVSDRTMRVYAVEGHSTKIIVPESYAHQLEQVRALRKAGQYPSDYNNLTFEQKQVVFAAMKNGDATGLSKFMEPADVSKYIAVYQAKFALASHSLRFRALPEDLVPILDALPNRDLVKEIHLLDTRNTQDVFKSVLYDSPGFQAAATVGSDGVVELYQQDFGSSLYNTTFHEWSHIAKWQSPAFSKMFDLASVVDHEDSNIDHKATAKARDANPTEEAVRKEGLYYPNLHSTRSQDENFAVGLGEAVMSPDPTDLFTYVGHAPVRAMTLSAVLERNLLIGSGQKESTFYDIMRDRTGFASDAARPWAIGTLEKRLASGTPEQKAAAAQLMGHFGTTEQAQELLDMASNKANHVVPTWKGTAAEEAMAGNTRTVAQHAFDSYLTLINQGEGRRTESARFEQAIGIMLHKPELRDLAGDYAMRSTDPRTTVYSPLIQAYEPNGTPTERAAGVELIKRFGGPDKADMLLSIALQKGNDTVPKYRNSGIPDEFAIKHRTVAQTAYNAYVDASVPTYEERTEFALQKGLEKPNQRELASNYLLKSGVGRARGLGKFLTMYDLPGHVSKMQELIGGELKNDAASQKLVFDRMMDLTDSDPRRQIELISDNLKQPTLIGSALNKLDTILTRGTTAQQRFEISDALNERKSLGGYSSAESRRMNEVQAHLDQENKVHDALTRIRKGQDETVTAMHDLAVMHDQRAIKPLLQQAVSGNETVEREAIGALQQFNPALVKFYAQELKRERFTNPVMTSKITDLIVSGRLSPPPPSVSLASQRIGLQ